MYLRTVEYDGTATGSTHAGNHSLEKIPHLQKQIFHVFMDKLAKKAKQHQNERKNQTIGTLFEIDDSPFDIKMPGIEQV